MSILEVGASTNLGDGDMAWITRDKTGRNPYRVFGRKPVKRTMVDYHGETLVGQQTWTLPGTDRECGDTYKPLMNHEPTTIDAADCPLELEPGEGPVEVRLSLVEVPSPRVFEGSGI